MKSVKHYFIGLQLPQNLKDYLYKEVTLANSELPFKIWTHREDFHITLSFLGEVKNLNEIIELLETFTSNLHSTELILNKVGTFGMEKRPRVFWVGVEKNEYLLQIQEELANLLHTNKIKEKETRPFTPHITIAKKWQGEGKINNLNYNINSFKFRIDKICLFEIQLNELPKYKVVASFNLKDIKGEHYGTTN